MTMPVIVNALMSGNTNGSIAVRCHLFLFFYFHFLRTKHLL